MAECGLQATEFRDRVVRNLPEKEAVEAAGDAQALAAILSDKGGHGGLCRLLQQAKGARTGRTQAREDLGEGATVAARKVVAHRKNILRIRQLPLLVQPLVAGDHRIQRRPLRKLFHDVVQIMTHLAFGLLGDLQQAPAKILAYPDIRASL